MNSNQSTSHKNIGALLHISIFSKFLIPFGNFIFPLLLWMCYKKDELVDKHGKECLNFQISTFLYAIGLFFLTLLGTVYFMVSINFESIQLSFEHMDFQYSPEVLPYFIFLGIMLFLFLALLIFEVICVILAAIKASEGEVYRYPLSIRFINESDTTQKTTE